MANDNMKVHLICNAIKAVAGIIVIGYVCKMTRSPWPLVAMIFIPQSSFSTNGNKAAEQEEDELTSFAAKDLDIPEEQIHEEK